MAKIEIRKPYPTLSQRNEVVEQFYEDTGKYYLLSKENVFLDLNQCLKTAYVDLKEHNNSFERSYGKTILLEFIKNHIYGFHEEKSAWEIVNGKGEWQSVLTPAIKKISKRMRTEILCTAHFCEELHQILPNGLFTKLLKDLPLVRIKIAENTDAYIHPKQFLENELFIKEEWAYVFKCYALTIVGWLKRNGGNRFIKKLFQQIYEDYNGTKYFDAVYRVVD